MSGSSITSIPSTTRQRAPFSVLQETSKAAAGAGRRNPGSFVPRKRIWWQHLLFWIAYFLFWTAAIPDTQSWLGMVINATYLLCHAGATYLTIDWILPPVLRHHRYVQGAFRFLVFVSLCALPIGLVNWLVDPAPGWETYFLTWEAFGAMFLSTYFVVMILVGVHLIRRQRLLVQHAQELERARLLAELDFLRAQINPHFLFNAINSIYFLIHKDPRQAGNALLQFSDLLRYQIYDCQTDQVPIEHEIDYLGNYVALEKVRKGPQLQVEFEPTGLLSGYAIAPFLLIPLVENAFKHVSAHVDRPNAIRIELEGQPQRLRLRVWNTSETRVASTSAGGLGLENLSRRLALLYPGAHHLNITPGESEFDTTLILEHHEPALPDRG